MDVCDVPREIGEQGAGDGVAVLGAVEGEDADGATVGGGDSADVYQGWGGAAPNLEVGKAEGRLWWQERAHAHVVGERCSMVGK